VARKHQLRRQRTGTVINETSFRQERALSIALGYVKTELEQKFPGIRLCHESQWNLKDVVARLRGHFPETEFHYTFERSAMKPDGGIISIVDAAGTSHCILIAEKKNQGTNNLRIDEGKAKQAKGNAIERLGKNVIGFRTALLNENIFPFVCFGDGCDFAPTSSILDRVVTIAMFGNLNREYLHNQDGKFNRGTFYFREAEWTIDEMRDLSYSIAEKSIYYYFSKYGDGNFTES